MSDGDFQTYPMDDKDIVKALSITLDEYCEFTKYVIELTSVTSNDSDLGAAIRKLVNNRKNNIERKEV